MADISQIRLPSGSVYNIKDAVAREAIAGGVSFIVAWDGNSTPVVSGIPNGVSVKYNGTTYTGTLSAETTGSGTHAQPGAFYLVHSSDDLRNVYAEYVPVGNDGDKSWEKIGDGDIDLSNYAKKGDGITGTAASNTTGISVSAHSVTNGSSTFTGNFTPTVTPTLSDSSSSGSVGVLTGGSNSSSSVSFSGSTDVYSMTSAGSVTPGSAASFTQGTDTHTTTTYSVANECLTIVAGGFTQGTDTHTPNTPTEVTLPGRSNKISALTTSTTATAAAQSFTPTTKYLTTPGTSGQVSVSGTTNVSISNHTITDSGHTHTVSGTINN